MKRCRFAILFLICALLMAASASAGTLRYENILALDVRDISLLTAPADADSFLRKIGFTSNEPQITALKSGKHSFNRVDELLHDAEYFELTYERGIITSIYYKHTYPEGYKKDTWKNFIHASEIDYALTVLCDEDATDSRDCKSRKLYDSPGMKYFTIEARRYGSYQQKYIARFTAFYEGYVWQIKHATPNE